MYVERASCGLLLMVDDSQRKTKTRGETQNNNKKGIENNKYLKYEKKENKRVGVVQPTHAKLKMRKQQQQQQKKRWARGEKKNREGRRKKKKEKGVSDNGGSLPYCQSVSDNVGSSRPFNK